MEGFSSYFSNRVVAKRCLNENCLFGGALVVFCPDDVSSGLNTNPDIENILNMANYKGNVLAIDAFGGLYVSDAANVVAKIDPETAEIAQKFAIGHSANSPYLLSASLKVLALARSG